MPIDFFQVNCKTESTSQRFGLCDNPDPAKDPAYIDETDDLKWIAEVQNSQSKSAEYFAVDHCVDVLRPNGEKAKRCDGILKYDSRLIFTELKDRGTSGWISDGRKQLTETIQFVDSNYNMASFAAIDAHICNKQRPLAITNNAIDIQKFKDETGLLLKIDRIINLT